MSKFRSAIIATFVLAVSIAEAESQKSTLEFTAGDHMLVTMWGDTLKTTSDQLDDCTYKGAFASLDRVPDVCNGAFNGGRALVDGHDKEGLPQVLLRSCAKWREGTRSAQNKKDCEELGRRYWRLAEALDRFMIANGAPSERQKMVDRGSATSDYIAKVNPGEVNSYAERLREINDALEKPNPNPGTAFHAGGLDAELRNWLLHHCPSELAWGIPAKPYTTATGECSALEPELQRFEINVSRMVFSTNEAAPTKSSTMR
jgi:hypothetical protein